MCLSWVRAHADIKPNGSLLLHYIRVSGVKNWHLVSSKNSKFRHIRCRSFREVGNEYLKSTLWCDWYCPYTQHNVIYSHYTVALLIHKLLYSLLALHCHPITSSPPWDHMMNTDRGGLRWPLARPALFIPWRRPDSTCLNTSNAFHWSSVDNNAVFKKTYSMYMKLLTTENLQYSIVSFRLCLYPASSHNTQE